MHGVQLVPCMCGVNMACARLKMLRAALECTPVVARRSTHKLAQCTCVVSTCSAVPPAPSFGHSSAATFPVTPFPAAGGSDPQTQCLVVSAWACILTGVVLPLLALHEIQRRAEQQHRAAAAAAAAGAAAAAEPGCVLPRRRRRASQSTLASVPENIIAEESMMAEKEVAEEAPLQAQAGPAQQEEEQVAAPAAATEADGPAEAGPLLQEANFLQWCLRPYFYSSLALSAVALVLPALPLAVDGSADGPAGNSPVG